MSQNNSFLAELLQQLPQNWHEPISALADVTLRLETPLRLILLGAFSVGKSSLVNMLLKESLLQIAMEETTALPTFIEYGPQRAMQLVGSNGSTLPLDEAGFAQATTQAPEDAACAVLAVPQSWLQGVSIVDLPGLGSVLSMHRDYTLAQIQYADAVLYLINPSGPSRSDLDMLKMIQACGKRVKVMVSQWDLVEQSVARGEKPPSFEQWSAKIEQATGLHARLAPCNRDGLGRDEVIDFAQRARNDLDLIRLQRFFAELKPVLENALGQNAEGQRSCESDSEEAVRAFHEELMVRKRNLSEFKAGLDIEQQKDRERVSHHCRALVSSEQKKLARELEEEIDQLTDDSQWEGFGQCGGDHLRVSTQQVARAFSDLSADYGALNLPEAQVIEFNLRLPAPEVVSADDFLDMGKLSQLQSELELHQVQFAAAEDKLASTQLMDTSEDEQVLKDLLVQHKTIAAQPLPKLIERLSNGNGAVIGRLLGEVADISLMFVNPTAAGVKVAALAGKGAKMANLSIKTTQVAKTVSTGVSIAQGVQAGHKSISGVPQPVMNKLSGLEKLSLGYWGERIGSMFSGSIDIEVVDPQVLATQQSALAEVNHQIQTLRRAIARNEDIANERALAGWALEQSSKEQARLKAELQKLQMRAEQQQRQAQENLQQERLTQLQHQANRAVSQWLRSFEQQTAAMIELIHARIKSHWQDRVEALADVRLQEIEQLRLQAQANVDERQALLIRLREEAQGIKCALATLN